MEFEVGAKFIAILAMIVSSVEGVKRILSIEWIRKILGLTEVGGGIALFLSVFGGFAIALKTYSGDGILTSQEVWLAICEALSATGIYKLTFARFKNGNGTQS